jgi:hypothetical protein
MSEDKAPRGAWPWPHHHDRVAQRDAAVAQAEADGHIVTEAVPDERVQQERTAEAERTDGLARAGDKLISAAPPKPDPFARETRDGVSPIGSTPVVTTGRTRQEKPAE